MNINEISHTQQEIVQIEISDKRLQHRHFTKLDGVDDQQTKVL